MEKPTDKELLREGMLKLDDALQFFSSIENENWLVMEHFTYALLTFGEKISIDIDDQ